MAIPDICIIGESWTRLPPIKVHQIMRGVDCRHLWLENFFLDIFKSGRWPLEYHGLRSSNRSVTLQSIHTIIRTWSQGYKIIWTCFPHGWDTSLSAHWFPQVGSFARDAGTPLPRGAPRRGAGWGKGIETCGCGAFDFISPWVFWVQNMYFSCTCTTFGAEFFSA